MQSREKIIRAKGKRLLLGDLVDILAGKQLKEKLENIEVLRTIQDDPVILVSAIQIIRKVKDVAPDAAVSYIGDKQIIVRVDPPGRAKDNRIAVLVKVALVWILLFIGTGLAIMNFHTDVNMGKVHREIYRMVTGRESQNPLVIQIPYSVGIGVGMGLFFNHFSGRKKNIEPSPLNVEMLSYEKGVYDYVVDKLKEQQKEV